MYERFYKKKLLFLNHPGLFLPHPRCNNKSANAFLSSCPFSSATQMTITSSDLTHASLPEKALMPQQEPWRPRQHRRRQRERERHHQREQ